MGAAHREEIGCLYHGTYQHYSSVWFRVFKQGNNNAKDVGGKKKEEEDETTLTTDKLDGSSHLLLQLHSKFQSAQSYGLDKVSFLLASSLYLTNKGMLFVLLGYMLYVWDMPCHVCKMYSLNYNKKTDEINISLIFMLFTRILGMITGLPFKFYSTFCIERNHNFNKTTVKLFITNKVK